MGKPAFPSSGEFPNTSARRSTAGMATAEDEVATTSSSPGLRKSDGHPGGANGAGGACGGDNRKAGGAGGGGGRVLACAAVKALAVLALSVTEDATGEDKAADAKLDRLGDSSAASCTRAESRTLPRYAVQSAGAERARRRSSTRPSGDGKRVSSIGNSRNVFFTRSVLVYSRNPESSVSSPSLARLARGLHVPAEEAPVLAETSISDGFSSRG